ncbi:MAG: hypothetical protein M9925_04300 [Chloroflexi bacterium]|nr:hypothetical protein [Dehalococcoidia bacterium]MCO5200903.1 hypothetical protein [Chloroflexota bacterium]MCZ7576879.1 hypothetical protein [Dehalococcoidia bacterium]
MRRKRFLVMVAAALGVVALIPVATALGDDAGGDDGRAIEAATALSTAFTYQGRLTDGGSPANGVYDLRFILWDTETGGAQVGSIVAKEDVTVTNGLFSVELDFGGSAFTGDARWLEIAVRPGSGTGATGYTILSPRQPVSPSPYAVFAKAAGGVAVPFTAAGTTAGAPSTPAGLITVNQAGTGLAIAGNRTSTDAAQYPAVLGTNAGGGAGVQGESTFATGVAVQGFAQGASGFGAYFSGPTGVKAVSSTPGGAALDIDGPIKVSGLNPAAYVHTVVTSGPSKNTCTGDVSHDPDAATFLTVTDSNAIVLITPVNVLVGTALSYYPASAPAWCPGVTNRWVIFSTDGSAIPNGAKFNILVINQ